MKSRTGVNGDPGIGELNALVKAGIFRSKAEGVKEALRLLFATRPQLSVKAAIQLYKEGEVTLGRAAEIAGITRWEFETLLVDRGIARSVTSDPPQDPERQGNGFNRGRNMLLADTNILSTFAKINELSLLSRLFGNQCVGVVPAVYAEFQVGVNKGYADLQAVVRLIQQGRIDLVAPTAQEVFQEDGLPASFDAGERETLAVAKSRGYTILTNETQIKNWCQRERIEYGDLPGLLRALWRTNLVPRGLVRSLIDQIETKDRFLWRMV